jgi:hypothetical protein
MSRDPSRELDELRDWPGAKEDRDADARRGQQRSAARRDNTPWQPHPGTVGRGRTEAPRLAEPRKLLYDRDHGYRLRASEIHTLAVVGKLRSVGLEDLVTHAYSGHRQAMQDDLQNLLRQGLVCRGVFEGPEGIPRELLTLTKAACHLLRANRIVVGDQPLYHGFVNGREANHDGDLYVLYQKEASRIQEQGGRPVRVLLDFELRKRINRDFARFGTEARPEIAARHGLRVVGEKIPLPDMRIEYERADREMASVDLELVTEHYRGCTVAEKAQAGFSLYTPRGEGVRLRRVLDERELTAAILSL